jgi:hypothetical protein
VPIYWRQQHGRETSPAAYFIVRRNPPVRKGYPFGDILIVSDIWIKVKYIKLVDEYIGRRYNDIVLRGTGGVLKRYFYGKNLVNMSCLLGQRKGSGI